MPPVSRRDSRRAPPPRDQAPSAFTEALGALVGRVPGALAAAIVDLEGETVDYAGICDPYEIKIAAAQWRIVLDEIRSRAALSRTELVMLRAGRASYQAHVLPDGYALVLILSRGAGFGGYRRAVSACCMALAREASWSWKGIASVPPWFPIGVTLDERRRPALVEARKGARRVEILGAVASGLRRRERAWRVRIEPGHEATLVREPGNRWYVDADLEGLSAGPPERLSPLPKKTR